MARCPAKVEQYRKGTVPNQVTRCIKIGGVIRKARKNGKDPVEAFIEGANAKKLFEGTVKSFETVWSHGQ